jgi:GMP synthase-like glutamine amidotransferase
LLWYQNTAHNHTGELFSPNDCKVFFLLHFLRGLGKAQNVLMTHGDSLDRVADTYKSVATSAGGHVVAAIANEKSKIYGVQFHPEVKKE